MPSKWRDGVWALAGLVVAAALISLTSCSGARSDGGSSSPKASNEEAAVSIPCPGRPDSGAIDMFPELGRFCPDRERSIVGPDLDREYWRVGAEAGLSDAGPPQLATEEDIERVRALERRLREIEGTGGGGMPDAGD